MPELPSWESTKVQSKKGFDKAWNWVGKLGAPVNRLSNRIGSEAFWPTTLDKESDKAARILRSFCKDGFYAEEEQPSVEQDKPNEKMKRRVIKKIPQKVIENAVGLAIFTTMRTGLWLSGAGGSGVLVARTEDGSWSPPSGIMLHTAGLGFLVGVDIYDCVLVINNRKALESFTRIRATLGGEISAVAGPVGMGGVVENDGKWKELHRPVFTYLKSRGFYAGVQMDGTIVIERTDENERFYGERIGVTDILAGKARHPLPEIKKLMETLKAAEGRSEYDEQLVEKLGEQPAPSDYDIDKSHEHEHLFGVPEPTDPDPYGVEALKKEGLEIVTAGSRSRPSLDEFQFHPSPKSPVYSKFRKSMEASDASENHLNRDSASKSVHQPTDLAHGSAVNHSPQDHGHSVPGDQVGNSLAREGPNGPSDGARGFNEGDGLSRSSYSPISLSSEVNTSTHKNPLDSSPNDIVRPGQATENFVKRPPPPLPPRAPTHTPA